MEQNLNLYQVFYEVAKCSSISVAAQKLYISQPAVSKSISKLELNLQTTLFHRSSRGVALTKEGDVLFKQVDLALSSIRKGEAFIRQSSTQDITELSIGVSTTLCKYVLLPALHKFMLDHPRVKLTISCQPTDETIKSIQAGSLSLGLIAITSAYPDIAYLPLDEIQDIFVATKDYLNEFPSYDEHNTDFLNQASFILLNKENVSRKHVEDYLLTHSITLKNMIEVNNMDLSIEFARSGLGIACVIQNFVKEDIQKGILQEMKFHHKIPKRQIGLAYAKNQELSKSMKQFIYYLQDHLLLK